MKRPRVAPRVAPLEERESERVVSGAVGVVGGADLLEFFAGFKLFSGVEERERVVVAHRRRRGPGQRALVER